ncbi:COG4223 family protein [Pseudorhodoplanes sinuspersici]|uniref:Uncharacterized protein n=1 Tax=Pseudorhodoplanes sinuspersici TaxID=1235591 RepID=A0A1W6ZPB4_9HYPH|nr:hypothetical protein [Pseudorhodoplanes sinuspersici]ARP99105.1 hypothetical protein CAK95_08415 [Pseudorhodoplanes sinuspersici]RKE69246.1 hypothetical protein DFP91_3675 [Pseudorhodoplanes sinuspersici]
MTDDKTMKPEGAADPRSKRPATIDLKAGEFTSETSAPETEVPPARETEDIPPPNEAWNQENAAPETPRSKRGGSLWPVIAAAAAAAAVFFVIGFGASQWLAGRLFGPTAAVAPAQFASNPELQTRLSKLEAAVAAPRQPDTQLLARIAAAEAAVKTATDMAAAREKRSDEIATIARQASERATSAAAAAEAAQKTNPATAESRAEIDTLTSRIATLEQSARAIEQTARSSETELKRRANEPVDDVRSRLAIVSMALRNAVESGMPFGTELSAAKALSADARAVTTLEPFAAGGVPTAAALGRELASLMPVIWKTARTQEASQGTFLERLQANAEKIVRVRPAGDIAGDDPGNVKARIEVRAESADIRGALAELAKLPPDARAPAQSWIAKAEARNAAIAAARELSQNALTALTKSGS